jgi:hypothetical protein
VVINAHSLSDFVVNDDDDGNLILNLDLAA